VIDVKRRSDMRGKLYSSPAQVDAMEGALCAISDAADEANDLPMTTAMARLFGEIAAAITKLHSLNQDRLEPVRPDDDRAAQALGWPERY
jgi:hypothetical protein